VLISCMLSSHVLHVTEEVCAAPFPAVLLCCLLLVCAGPCGAAVDAGGASALRQQATPAVELADHPLPSTRDPTSLLESTTTHVILRSTIEPSDA
jgi:hypothetical protein